MATRMIPVPSRATKFTVYSIRALARQKNITFSEYVRRLLNNHIDEELKNREEEFLAMDN